MKVLLCLIKRQNSKSVAALMCRRRANRGLMNGRPTRRITTTYYHQSYQGIVAGASRDTSDPLAGHNNLAWVWRVLRLFPVWMLIVTAWSPTVSFIPMLLSSFFHKHNSKSGNLSNIISTSKRHFKKPTVKLGGTTPECKLLQMVWYQKCVQDVHSARPRRDWMEWPGYAFTMRERTGSERSQWLAE